MDKLKELYDALSDVERTILDQDIMDSGINDFKSLMAMMEFVQSYLES